MEQRTEVAVATELSLVKRALGGVVLLGGMMLFSWLMAGTAHADAPDRPGQAGRAHEAGHGLGIASEQAPPKLASESRPPEKPEPQQSQPERPAPARSETRPTAPLEKRVAETGQQVRDVTRPVTRAVTETLDRTPVAPITHAVTDTAGKTVQTVVREVRSTIGSTPVDPVLDVTDGVARDLSGDGVAEPVARGESSTLVDESPSSATENAASDARSAAPVSDPERRAAPPPSTRLLDSSSQASDRSGDTAPEPPIAPTDPTDVAPPCAQSGAASPSAPGAAADQTIAALDLRTAGHPVATDPLVRVGGPSYEPGCSPD